MPETKMDVRKSVVAVFSREEISLLEVIALFTTRLKFIGISFGFFLIIGLLIAITSPVEYAANATLLSENGGGSQASGAGGMAGLAAIAGISLPTGGAAGGAGSLSPDMYPAIATSEPFLIDLMKERFFFQEKGKEMSLFEYFSEERPGHIFTKTYALVRGIPGRVFSLLEKKKEWDIPKKAPVDSLGEKPTSKNVKATILYLNDIERYVIAQLKPRIDIEAEGRIISVKVKMPEPYISAQLNTIVLDKLIQYVTAYTTEKQRDNLDFILERTKEAETKFNESQMRLARFRDANQGIVTQTARTVEERLQAEFSLTREVYTGLAQQLEQTKIQLKKETPLFTDFEPVTIPLSKAEPNIPRTLAIYTAFGLIFGFLAIFVSIFRSYFRELSNERIIDDKDEG